MNTEMLTPEEKQELEKINSYLQIERERTRKQTLSLKVSVIEYIESLIAKGHFKYKSSVIHFFIENAHPDTLALLDGYTDSEGQ